MVSLRTLMTVSAETAKPRNCRPDSEEADDSAIVDCDGHLVSGGGLWTLSEGA